MSPRGGRGGGPRSEDDRQRARLEREQRRAQREGRPVPRSLEDLPAAEPTLDPADLGVPSSHPPAPRAAPEPFEAPASGEAPGSREAPAPSRTPEPYETPTSRETPASYESPASRETPAPYDTPAPQPSSAPTPQPLWGSGSAASDAGARGQDRTATGAAEPAAEEPPASSSGPWWSRGAAGPPPPPAAPAPPASTRPAPPAASRPGTSPAAQPGTPPTAQPSLPPTAQPGPSPEARRGDAPPATDRSVRPTEGAGHAPPRGTSRAAAVGGAPPTREVENWFGPDETGDHTGDRPSDGDRRDAAEPAEGPGLLPLRPAGPAPTSSKPTKPRKPTRKERRQGIDPATVHTRTAPARRGVSRVAAFLVLLILAILIAGSVFLFQPLKGDGEGEVRVRIPPGSSIDDIGRLLKDRGVISNALAFSVRARISGDGANLKAGTLRLKKGMSYGAALTALQQDPLPPSVVRVSIPEGLSRTEVASTIKKAGVTGSYLTASARSTGFDPKDYGQPAARRGLEGFLFPATYELQRGGATSKDLVSQQLKLFKENIGEVSMTRAKRAKMSVYDVLIIASMIEREVRVPSERKLVAAVIYNRLEQNIALGIDATTRYAVKNWTRPLKQSEIDSKTPYDTRYRKGLPPTPIGSPGLASIKAAANPARSSYLYYVVRPCSDGRHNFATTNVEFEKDRATYNAAQRRAGGDPSPKDAKGCPSR